MNGKKNNMLAYVHFNPESTSFVRGTFAVVVPDKFDLEQNLNHLIVNLGLTTVYAKTQFNKSIGRNEATKNITPQFLKLDRIEDRNGRIIKHYTTTVEHFTEENPTTKYYKVELGFSYVNEFPCARVEYIIFG